MPATRNESVNTTSFASPLDKKAVNHDRVGAAEKQGNIYPDSC